MPQGLSDRQRKFLFANGIIGKGGQVKNKKAYNAFKQGKLAFRANSKDVANFRSRYRKRRAISAASTGVGAAAGFALGGKRKVLGGAIGATAGVIGGRLLGNRLKSTKRPNKLRLTPGRFSTSRRNGVLRAQFTPVGKEITLRKRKRR